jgi:hypothetical protein
MNTLYGKEALVTLTNYAPDYEEIDEGEQRKYNHEDCHAGTDTKQRLYVKNVDGAYLWHCHNCGDSGFYRPKETVKRIKEHSAVAGGIGSIGHRPYTTELYSRVALHTDFDGFRDEGKLWLSQYGFDRELCRKNNIYEGLDGIMLPVYNDTEEAIRLDKYIHGWQIRRYNKKPKYLSYINEKFSYRQRVVKKKLIIVEDLLSSYKLVEAGYSTLCLLGTSLSKEALNIVTQYRTEGVVLWLDDDQAGHDATMQIYKDIGPVAACTAIYLDQPKEIDLETLKGMDL